MTPSERRRHVTSAKEHNVIETDILGESAGGPTPIPGTNLGAPATGRFIVVFADDEDDPGAVLTSAAGLPDVATSRDFKEGEDLVETAGRDGTIFAGLGMAVVSADPDQLAALQTSRSVQGRVLSVSPELVHHIMGASSEYVQGYRDGVSDLSDRLGTASDARYGSSALPSVPIFQDSAQFTWGLQATETTTSAFSGNGIRVAVLDTGFNAAHPDFAGRAVTMKSFIPGESAEDGHGHGTHCIGTACGSKAPSTGPRYGVAYGAEIFAGKVLSNAGSGSDSGILAGIEWALVEGCAIISMSLGADVAESHPPYTTAGRRALDQGVLIIAAAGNNARRLQGNNGIVGAPANSPYILAVGALNQQLDLTFFSARSLPLRGGQVDVAGPGWQVYSSWPMPTRYRAISGTSMATPHAAGVAALWAEATGYRGRELWSVMVQESQRLIEPSVDVGSGLILAPQ
jgi:subtilisin family serine protease